MSDIAVATGSLSWARTVVHSEAFQLMLNFSQQICKLDHQVMEKNAQSVG